MRSVLTTVGTSLLTNMRRDLELGRDVFPTDQEVANYLVHTELNRASAETNSLSHLLDSDSRILFLHSQTREGEWCAQALARFYRNRGHRTECIEIDHLNYVEKRFKMRGLRSLVVCLVNVIKDERKLGNEVLINATGGFKAEIAYATLVGLIFDVPIFYIHEVFRDVIELPAIPIGWDYSIITNNEEFFEWIYENDRPTDEVMSRLKCLPESIALLLQEEDGHTVLSPVGLALFESYLVKIDEAANVPFYLSPEAANRYRRYPVDIQKKYDRIFVKIRVKEFRRSGSHMVNNCDCLVYPSVGRERVFYIDSMEEGDEGVYVCEIGDHKTKSYESLIDRGVRRADYPKSNFQKWEVKG